jgi:hypothetical protein
VKNILKKFFVILSIILFLFVLRNEVFSQACTGVGLGNEGDACCMLFDGNMDCCMQTSGCEITQCTCNSGFTCAEDLTDPSLAYSCHKTDQDCGARGEDCCIDPQNGWRYCNLPTDACNLSTEKCEQCGLNGRICCTVGERCRTGVGFDLECVQQGSLERCIEKTGGNHVCNSKGSTCCLNIGTDVIACNWQVGMPIIPGCYCDGGWDCVFDEVSGAICEDEDEYWKEKGQYCNSSRLGLPCIVPFTNQIGTCEKQGPLYRCVRPGVDIDVPPPVEIGEIGEIISTVITYLFPLAGLVCLIFIIQGGYMWIVSSGNPESLKKAQGTLTWAIIGLFLTMTIFGILVVVLNFLYRQ